MSCPFHRSRYARLWWLKLPANLTLRTAATLEVALCINHEEDVSNNRSAVSGVQEYNVNGIGGSNHLLTPLCNKGGAGRTSNDWHLVE
jgi:hypothetical protein